MKKHQKEEQRMIDTTLVTNYPSQMTQKVSVIILNWNRWEDTIECLESLHQIIYPNYDAIVIDNGSEDDSVERIKEFAEGKKKVESKFFEYDPGNKPIKYIEYTREEAEDGGGKGKEDKIVDLSSSRRMILIKNEKNLGFAGGCNVGIQYALQNGADYVLLLNNDTVVKEDFLDILIEQASKYPDAGAIDPKIYFYDEPDKIWFAGGYIDWKYDGAHIGYRKLNDNNYNTEQSVEFITGCAMLIKKEVIEKVGLLDSSFFAYQEDVDFCVRMRKAGYKCLYIPYSHVWHKGGATTKKEGRMSPFHRYLGTRNKLALFKKNFGWLKFGEVLIREIFVVTPILILLYAYRRHFDLIPAQIQGIIDSLKGKNKYLTII